MKKARTQNFNSVDGHTCIARSDQSSTSFSRFAIEHLSSSSRGTETVSPVAHDLLRVSLATLNVISLETDPTSNRLNIKYIIRQDSEISTYGHSQLKTGHPVRSAIHKQLNGRLVLRWVTTWESLLLYVLHFLFLSLTCKLTGP